MPASTWPRCQDAVVIAPSLLAADFSRLAEAVLALEESGVERLHIDVMDGNFVPNFTFGSDTFRSLRKLTALPFEAHLMIVEPDKHLKTFAQAGADAITVHHEVCPNLSQTLSAIKSLDCRAGAAINPETDASVLDGVLSECDLALVMTVHPGFGGQSFINDCLQKVRHVRNSATAQGLQIDVEVDGGVDASNVSSCVEAGANVIVAGSAIFQSDDPSSSARQLQEIGSAALKR